MELSKRRASLIIALLMCWGCADDATGEQGAPPQDLGADMASDAADAVDQDNPQDMSEDAASALDMSDSAPDVDMSASLPLLKTCDSGALPSGLALEEWRGFGSRIVAASGDPDHSAQDVISPPAESVTLEGKFSYGAVSKDLEDERVQLWIDDCAGSARQLGAALTDSDGRGRVTLEPAAVPAPGTYKIWWRVAGDGSVTQAWLRVIPRGSKLMVLDIDGTLTTDDVELFQDIFTDLFKPILGGDHVPSAREASAQLTNLRRGQGYQLVYLTGRPYALMGRSREWLAQQGCAPGTLHLTDSVSQIAPSDGVVGEYKAAYLRRLQALGYTFEAGYGNATTDIYAYGEAGLPKPRTYIAGKHGGESGTVDVGDGWAAHVVDAAQEPDAQQPFRE